MTENNSDLSKGLNNGNNSQKSDNKRPILENNRFGFAAWINSTDEGNAYLNVKLGFIGEYVNLYPSSEEIQKVFNNLLELIEQQELNKAGGDK